MYFLCVLLSSSGLTNQDTPSLEQCVFFKMNKEDVCVPVRMSLWRLTLWRLVLKHASSSKKKGVVY